MTALIAFFISSILVLSNVEAFGVPSNLPDLLLRLDTHGMCSSIVTIQKIPIDISTMAQHQIHVSNDRLLIKGVLFIIDHAILDLATIFAPDSNVLRVFVLIGRLYDFLIDSIFNNGSGVDKGQLFFQLFLLYLSADAVLNSYVKPLSTYLRNKDIVPTFRDLKIFQKYFRESGLSWQQFCLLQSCNAIEWIEMEKNGDIHFCKQSDIVLVYRGNLYVHEIDQIVSGDRGKSNKGFTIVNNKENHIFLNLYLQQPKKVHVHRRQQHVVEDNTLISCIEARSNHLVLLKFDMQQISSGIVAEADDLFQLKLNNLWIQILLQARLNA